MLRYKIYAAKSPATKEIFYYPKPYTDATPLETLCENVSQKTTLTRTDVHAGLCAFEEVIARHLQNGESVNMGKMGIFKARIRNGRSFTEEQKDKMTVASIKRVTVGFRPSMAMGNDLRDCKFEKYGSGMAGA